MSNETKIQKSKELVSNLNAIYNATIAHDHGIATLADRCLSILAALESDHLAAVEEAREAGFAEARAAAVRVTESPAEGLVYKRTKTLEEARLAISALRPAEKGEKA